MKKILIGCNILTSIDGIAYPSHCQNWYNWGRYLTDYTFLFYSPRRSSIDNMRNTAARLAMESECEYLFFYDDDCLFPVNTLKRLMSHDVSIVSGLTFIRAHPFEPMVFTYKGEDKDGNGILEYDKNVIDKTKLYSCHAVGFSCVLIKVDILKKMRPPFFVTGSFTTEDIYFCIRLQKEQGITIFCDPSIEVTHIVDRYAVNRSNRKQIQKFEEDVLERNKGRVNLSDRGQEYIDACRERLEEVATG